MKKTWNFISNVGVTSGLSAEESRTVVLLNRICCIVCLFILGYTPFLFLFGETVMIPFLIPEILLFGFTFFLVSRQKYNTAKIYFLINGIIFLGLIGLVPGKDSGDKYLLIASAVLPLLFFRKKSYIISFFLINIIVFFSIYTYQSFNPALLDLPSFTISIFYYFNISTSFILIFLVIYYFKKLNDEYEVNLIHKSNIIEEQNIDITDSIRYAKRIQDAILTSEGDLKKALLDHFILYKPREVVSGDFYWTCQMENKVIWTAADCTGHGVPGAFMSMIGNSLLNEIIIEKRITDADSILNELRDSIIRTLGKGGKEAEPKDGMDMALCVWNKETNRLGFAGANNPLYLVRNNLADSELMNNRNVTIHEDYLAEIKGDKQPVGYQEGKDGPFTGHEIQLEQGDIIYTFSDGYQDQIGGEANKKFMVKRFRQLIVSLRGKSMNEQKEVLDRTLENWKGDEQQIDDICIIGVRI